MGIRKLAYSVKKFERGNYTVYYFKAPANAIGEIERIIRINEEIIKFLTVKYDNKKEVAHWEKSVANIVNRNKKDEAASKPEKKESEEADAS
jgi:small subunit ribosomal protein S6